VNFHPSFLCFFVTVNINRERLDFRNKIQTISFLFENVYRTAIKINLHVVAAIAANCTVTRKSVKGVRPNAEKYFG